MFDIKIDDYYVHQTKNDVLQCFDISYNLNIAESGRLTFSTAYDHPRIDTIQANKVVRLYQKNELIFIGEVVSIETDSLQTKTFECWGILSKLSQSTMPYIGDVRMDVGELFSLFINQYNTDISEKFRLKVGEITVTDPNNVLPRQINYGTVKDNIQSKLIDPLGGYLRIREETDGIYIDYIATYTALNGQGIRFGENLVSILMERNTHEIYTAVRPYGAKIGSNTEQRVDITSVNGGIDFIYNADAEDFFGRRVTTIVFDDVTLPENLLTRGYEYLSTVSSMLDSFDLDSFDLSLIDVTFDRLKIGDTIPVVSKPHGIDTFTDIVAINYSNNLPTITLGKLTKKFTDNAAKTDYKIDTVISDYVVNSQLSDLNNTLVPMIENNTSLILQEASEIMFEVEKNYTKQDDFVAYQAYSQEITAEQIEFVRTTLNGQIIETDQKIDDYENFVEEYIRFDGASIEIGRSDSDMKLQLENDSLQFLNNGQVVSYMTGQEMYITNAHIVNRLQIGNIGLFVEENLSFSIL